MLQPDTVLFLLSCLSVFGFVLEIIGVVMMANRFLGVDVFSLVWGLYSAVFRSRVSGVISELASDDDESVHKTFRGLSFLLWGFTIQLLVFCAEKFWI